MRPRVPAIRRSGGRVSELRVPLPNGDEARFAMRVPPPPEAQAAAYASSRVQTAAASLSTSTRLSLAKSLWWIPSLAE